MSRFRFSANLGYLWTELPFLDRIRAAAEHGFDAVEFHDQAQTEDRVALKAVLHETQLPVTGLNIRMGGTAGCAAIPGQQSQARRDIDAAIDVATDIGAGAIHVLSGITHAPEAQSIYIENLTYALSQFDGIILIEPVSAEQLPGFFLRRLSHAAAILAEVNHPRLKIMFDCYHIHAEGDDVAAAFAAHAPLIGHVQIAAAEHRAEPYPGALNYAQLLSGFRAAGYKGVFGCEYRPAAGTTNGLGWRDA